MNLDKVRLILVKTHSIKLICLSHVICILIYTFYAGLGNKEWSAFFFGVHGIHISLLYMRYSICEYKSANDRKILFFLGVLFLFITPYWIWSQYERPSDVFDKRFTISAMLVSAVVTFMVSAFEPDESC